MCEDRAMKNRLFSVAIPRASIRRLKRRPFRSSFPFSPSAPCAIAVNRLLRSALVLFIAGSLPPFVLEASARADVPVGYKGKPFDPALAGGVGHIPPTVKAGPYPIPGRLDFINYDLGGEMVAYHAGDHITNNGTESVKLALGYRTDA